MKKLNKLTFTKSLSLLAALSVILVSGASVFADENGGTADSKATISFKANEGPTDPINPIDPEQPDPEEPGTGMDGPLSLDVVPTLTFGEQDITGKVETYESTNLKPYLQVTDTRGTGAGWVVSASLTDFENSSNEKLDDAMIVLEAPTVKTTSSNTSAAPIASQKVELEAGNENAVTVFSASENQGMGTWLNTWISSNAKNEKAKLKVNTSNAKATAYEATLNWTLSVAP